MALTITHKAEDAAPKLVPPYVPYRSFGNFIQSLKQGIPARIDRSVMSNMSGALQSQLTSQKMILLMNTELNWNPPYWEKVNHYLRIFRSA